MTSTTKPTKRHRDLLERILATVEAIDQNVEEILEELHDHLADIRFSGWIDEPYADHEVFD